MRRVYFDNNASSPVLPEVFEAVKPFYLERFGNASSIHHHGQHARAAVEGAREQVARLLNCRAAEIVFTSGGTEGDNMALFGMLEPGDHLVTSNIEHSAVRNTAKVLQKRGCEVTLVPADSEGRIDAEDVRRAVTPKTKLISIMMANNETGVIQPVEEIGQIAKEADVWFHTDAVQAAGKIPVDVEKIGCDLLTISGHKIHAPQGTGAVYVRRGTLCQSLLYGGTHERQRRAGTENLPGIVGLGKAAEIAREWFDGADPQKMAAMRDRLQNAILAQVEGSGVNGMNALRVPNTTNLWFDYIEGEPLVIALDLKGLAVSTGAACSSGAIEPSPVLLAMGIKPEQARASIRVSLGKQNTADEVEFAIATIPPVVQRLREISPLYKQVKEASAQSVS